MKLLTIKMTAVSSFDLQYNENWSTPTLPRGFGAGHINKVSTRSQMLGVRIEESIKGKLLT